MVQKTKLYLLTEEELERFDQMLTALGQAYWALMRSRSINTPQIDRDRELTLQEKNYFNLHRELNDEIEQTDSF